MSHRHVEGTNHGHSSRQYRRACLHHAHGERRVVGRDVGRKIFILIDDHADQRQQTPHHEQADREEHVAEGVDKIGVRALQSRAFEWGYSPLRHVR